MNAVVGQSPFLTGNFGPIRSEVTADSLEVIGEIPAELDGSFVRNGPNPQFDPPGAYHWFEGDGMLHAVRLKAGRAGYRNRWMRTAGFEKERAAGTALWKSGMDGDITAMQAPKNAANTALVQHAGKMLALWEGGPPTEADVETLQTLGLHDFDGALKMPFTAHPKLDAQTGELLYFGQQVGMPKVGYGVVDASGKIVHQASFKVPVSGTMHDFAITEQYAVFFDLPMKFRIERAMRGQMPLSWEPETGLRVGIMPRRGQGDEMRWFELAPCFFYHIGNAYEDGDELVFTAVRMDCSTFAGALPKLDASQGEADVAYLHEWRLNLKTGAHAERRLDDVGGEFPRVAPSVVGRYNRYTYGVHSMTERGITSLHFRGAYKYDHQADVITEQLWGDGFIGGENSFVPRPGGTSEDDGWLLGYVYDSANDRSELRILDARDLSIPPVARVMLPQRVPFGFHGDWMAPA